MAIAVNLPLEEDEKAVWLFPVSGDPGDVKVDVIEALPAFYGSDPRKTARRHLQGFSSDLRWGVFVPLGVVFGVAQYGGAMGELATETGSTGVVVHLEVAKWGIQAEVVTAESVEALAAHLAEEGASLSAEQLATFGDYTGGDHVLVLAWIASLAELLEHFPEYKEQSYLYYHWPTLLVEFAAEGAFYPLKPTAAYGDMDLPLTLTVVGHVEPDGPSVLTDHMKVRHLVGKEEKITADEANPLAIPQGEVAFTNLTYKGPASNFTADLTFRKVKIRGIAYARLVNGWARSAARGILTIACILVFSSLSGGVGGFLAYRRFRRYALVAVPGVLTIVPVVIVWAIVRAAGREAGRPGTPRAVADLNFWLVYAGSYIVLTHAICFMLLLPLGL
jgi:hypothetical protein